MKGSQESGGLPDVREPVVDLFAAETGGLLTCVLELLGDELGRVSDLIPQRIRSEIEARILDPALARDDFWWMGLGDPGRKLNNWTPWIVSNWLLCSLLADDNPGRRLAGIYKAAGCLDRYLAQLPADGGCDEGPSYWGRAGGSLFDGLEILHSASHGELTCYDEPLVREIGAYIARVHIGGDWFVNFADAPARPRLRPHTVYGYGVRTRQSSLMQLGAWLGLTPKQNSSGGKARLGGITKRGDTYLRTLLIQGAKAVVLTGKGCTNNPIGQWAQRLRERVGWQKAIVALANKNARILWAVLTREAPFDAHHISVKPTAVAPL